MPFLEAPGARLLAAPELAEHFGHRLARADRRILRRIGELLRGPASLPPAPVPAPLPAAPDPFVGREAEPAGLLALPDAHRFVLVRGGPGIGKTALTLAAAHHAGTVSRFGHRRFFAALGAATAGGRVRPYLRSGRCAPVAEVAICDL